MVILSHSFSSRCLLSRVASSKMRFYDYPRLSATNNGWISIPWRRPNYACCGNYTISLIYSSRTSIPRTWFEEKFWLISTRWSKKMRCVFFTTIFFFFLPCSISAVPILCWPVLITTLCFWSEAFCHQRLTRLWMKNFWNLGSISRVVRLAIPWNSSINLWRTPYKSTRTNTSNRSADSWNFTRSLVVLGYPQRNWFHVLFLELTN